MLILYINSRHFKLQIIMGLVKLVQIAEERRHIKGPNPKWPNRLKDHLISPVQRHLKI